MTFIWPELLLAVLLVPLGLVAYRAIDQRRRRRAEAYGGLGLIQATSRPGAGRGAWIPVLLTVVGLTVMAIAMARPQATISLPKSEGTVMLVFDVSASMAATDVAPSRIEVAKAAATSFVDQQPQGVVTGIVAFSDAGLTIQQPTRDRASLKDAIDRLLPTRGTSLGQGILAALEAIKVAEADVPAEYYSNRSPAPSPEPVAPVEPGSHGSAVVVVLSDGENNQDPDPLEVAQIAADHGIRVVTLGVGSVAGTTIDLEGFAVHTQLDEALLQQVAAMTTGSYLPAEQASALTGIYASLERRVSFADEHIEITAILAGLALALLVAAGVISYARAGRLP